MKKILSLSLLSIAAMLLPCARTPRCSALSVP